LSYLIDCSGIKYHLFIALGTESACRKVQLGAIFL
jgi:hypothetical protein